MQETIGFASALSFGHWFNSDSEMDQLYPESVQLLATKHWTPLNITKLVVQFLVPHKAVKVLDIGSGVGKFCLAAAFYKPQASFYGVEQRKHLVDYADEAKKSTGLQNVHFLHQNLTKLNFNRFDHFYFYNSFYENLMNTDKIDDSVICAPNLYIYYNRYLYKKMEGMPSGTRIATFHSISNKMPPGFDLVESHLDQLLKFWIKT
jgi:SAM-dependent methyltransferase